MVRKVDIRGHIYDIKQVSQKKLGEIAKVIDTENHEKGDTYAGLLDDDKNVIWLLRDQAESKKWSTILHEVFHGVDPTLSEDQVITLENGMYQFLLVNKRFRF